MALVGSTIFSPNPKFFPASPPKRIFPRNIRPRMPNKITATASSNGSNLMMTDSAVSSSEVVNFGFRNLTETFWVDVQEAEGRPLNVPLFKPLETKSGSIKKVENVAVRVELKNGCVGWGEVAVMPGNQKNALSKAKEACEFLRKSGAMTLTAALDEIGRVLPGSQLASVRAAVEMALIDAVANSIGVPLWRLFGGASSSLPTTLTISHATTAEATDLALRYRENGVNTLKLNLGRYIDQDLETLKAIKTAHPQCSVVLDANERYSYRQAIEALEKLNEIGFCSVLLEEPFHKHDWKALGDFAKVARSKFGVYVAVDERCEDMSSVQKVIKENLADVINIKLARYGVLGALRIIEVARKSGINLMIDSLVETRLGTGFAAHLAAGLGCFKYINLNTPYLLLEDPVVGGYEEVKVASSNGTFPPGKRFAYLVAREFQHNKYCLI